MVYSLYYGFMCSLVDIDSGRPIKNIGFFPRTPAFPQPPVVNGPGGPHITELRALLKKKLALLCSLPEPKIKDPRKPGERIEVAKLFTKGSPNKNKPIINELTTLIQQANGHQKTRLLCNRGFVYAWSFQFPQAEKDFIAALEVDVPDDEGKKNARHNQKVLTEAWPTYKRLAAAMNRREP